MRDSNADDRKAQVDNIQGADNSETNHDDAPTTKVENNKRAPKKKTGKPEDETTDVTKRRRTWELWTASDKHMFFEALNEYGKDFDKIVAHFQNKLKNKNTDYIKNKNQIRHLYYRSWHKISPYINFTKDLKKNTKELFGLINYGELWKKVGGTFDDRLGAKLDELVHKGSATIKHKGKTFRVKTPVCRALKRIHNKLDNTGKPKGGKLVPSKVTIDLKPRETEDWCRVQKIAQNPHIKVTMSLQRKLSSLIKCISNKWRSRKAKVLERSSSFDEDQGNATEELVLFPLKGAKLNLAVITVLPVITSSQISLQNMKQEEASDCKLKVKYKLSDRETLVTEANGNRDENKTSQPQAYDCDKSAATTEQLSQEETEGADAAEDFIMEDSEGESSRSPVPPQEKDSDAEMEVEKEEEEKEAEFEEKEEVEDKEEEKETAKESKNEKPKNNFSNLKHSNPSDGWSLSTCGECTIGELYLMLVEDGGTHFDLEYHWRTIKIESRDVKEKAESDPCQTVLSRLMKLSSSNPVKAGRGRQNSVSTSSPGVRNLMSPVSPVTSRASPVGRSTAGGRGAVKQLPLAGDKADKPGSPLAVPLDQEVEFRKPLTPVIKPAAVSSTFQQQIGQYFPKFSNRRGRQNRSKNQLVGRQILQPIHIQPKQPQQVLVLNNLAATQTLPSNNNPIFIETPLILSTTALPSPAADNILQAPPPLLTTPQSPPQICIPSPALSPVRRSPSPTSMLNVPPRSPSPAPSFSALMDITFPESAPSTPSKSDNFLSMIDDASMLHTPPRASSPPPSSPSRCLTESADVSLNSWALSFDSPVKTQSVSVIHNEDSQASIISTNSEVDRQLTAMMNENSLDFTSTFRQLAKHVTSSDQELSQT